MSTETETPTPRRRLFVLLPLLIFLGLAGLFLSQLLSGRDVSEVPSALIGLPAPQTNLPALEGSNLPGLDSKSFAGKVTRIRVTVANPFGGVCANRMPVGPVAQPATLWPTAPSIIIQFTSTTGMSPAFHTSTTVSFREMSASPAASVTSVPAAICSVDPLARTTSMGAVARTP